jgi:hypothetical protein
MNIDAVAAGFISTAVFLVFSAICVLVIKRTARPGFWATGIFPAIEAAVLLLTPPPLVLLTKAGYLEIGGPGHAGNRFMVPSFPTALIIVFSCLLYLRRKQTRH